MPFLLHIISIAAIYIPLSLSYTFLFGRGRVLHFGPIGIAIVTAYACFLTLIATGSFLLAFGAGLMMALVCSTLFAWLSFRLDPDGLGILTIAMHLAMFNVVLNWQSLTRGALGLVGIPRLWFMESQGQFAFWISVVAIAWILFFLWLDRTPLARQMSALAEQELHAKSLGIKKFYIHLVGFLLVGATLASENFFYAQYLHLLYPTDYMFPSFIFLLMYVVAGRPGNVLGAALSTILLMTLKEGLRFLPLPSDVLGPLRLIIFGVILLAAVWIQRDTLFPKKRTI